MKEKDLHDIGNLDKATKEILLQKMRESLKDLVFTDLKEKEEHRLKIKEIASDLKSS